MSGFFGLTLSGDSDSPLSPSVTLHSRRNPRLLGGTPLAPRFCVCRGATGQSPAAAALKNGNATPDADSELHSLLGHCATCGGQFTRHRQTGKRTCSPRCQMRLLRLERRAAPMTDADVAEERHRRKLAYQRRWRERNRERLRESSCRYQAEHHEARAAYRAATKEAHAAYRKAHPDASNAANRRWRAKHRDDLLARRQAAYAALRAAGVPSREAADRT